MAQGTYYPSDSTVLYDGCTGNAIATVGPSPLVSFTIPDSAVVLGGYGHGADSLTRDWQCNKTILCGDIDRNGNLTGNSYHVVYTKNVDSVTAVCLLYTSTKNGKEVTGINTLYQNYPNPFDQRTVIGLSLIHI